MRAEKHIFPYWGFLNPRTNNPLKEKWRGWDLNPEPMAYESTAPPLSYLAFNEHWYYLKQTEKSTKISGTSNLALRLLAGRHGNRDQGLGNRKWVLSSWTKWCEVYKVRIRTITNPVGRDWGHHEPLITWTYRALNPPLSIITHAKKQNAVLNIVGVGSEREHSWIF